MKESKDENLFPSDVEDDNGESANLHRPFERMRNIYDKLMMLEYNKDFIQLVKIRPIHSLYFMIATNPGEQFFNFATISAWLLRKCGRSIDMPQESDDPNTVISSILANVRNMGGILDFPPSKVKSGCGEEVVATLDFLTDKAIVAAQVHWEDPVFPVEDDIIVEEEDDEPELNLEKVEEAMDEYYSSEDDEIDSAWVQPMSSNQNSNQAGNRTEHLQIMKSETDTEQWRMEVERVLPQLKITIKTDSQDWRWRQDQMKSYTSEITDILGQMEKPLDRLITDATGIADKVANREKHLNSQFASQLEQLSQTQATITKLKESHRQQSNEVATRNKELAHLGDELDETRRQLDDRGSIMADGAPVVAVRKALSSLKKELGDMEVEIGVMEHCVLKSLVQEQMILRDKSKNF